MCCANRISKHVFKMVRKLIMEFCVFSWWTLKMAFPSKNSLENKACSLVNSQPNPLSCSPLHRQL